MSVITLAIRSEGLLYTPLNKESGQRYDKSGNNLDFNIPMGGASHIYPQKDESYLDILHQLL